MKRLTINDLDELERILKHKDIYEHITDNSSPKKEDLSCSFLLNNPNIYVLSPTKNSLIILKPVTGITYEIHVNFLKSDRGTIAIEGTKKALKYIFNKTACEKLICWIPVNYKNVLAFSESMGMVKEGYCTKCVRKKGITYDKVLLGMTRKEYIEKWGL